MEKISFEVEASDANIRAQSYQEIRIEVDGVDLSDLIDAIEDNDAIINIIGSEAIADYFSTECRLFDLLEHFDAGELADFLKERGCEVGNESDD